MEEKYSVDETKSIRTGLIAMIAILLGVFMTVSHNAKIEKNKLSGAYKVYASFGKTDGLNVGDMVRMSGVNIGRVISSELDKNFNSRLTLELDSKYKIPDDSSASIVSFGLIGGKYVEIEVGGSEDYIPPEGTIEYTQDAMILEDLLARIISMGQAKRKKTEESKNTEDNDTLSANEEQQVDIVEQSEDMGDENE